MTCSSCGELANYVPCDTRKIWEFPSGAGNKVTVYHYGVHSCIAVKPTISTSAAQAAFHQVNSAKPGRMVNNHIIDAIESEKSLEEIENLNDSLLDKKSLQRKKLAASQKLDPVGHSYDAVMHYKAKVEKVLNDPYLIYKFDCEKKIVFKTSKEQLEMALQMDKGQGHLKTEACHVHGKHNRLSGYITISLVVYDANWRELAKIATMECPSESKDNIGMFWTCLNSALRQLTHDNNCQFRPHLYMFDEGGGFWASLKEQLGPDELT